MLGLRRKGQGMDVSRRPRRLSREDFTPPDRKWNNELDDDAPAHGTAGDDAGDLHPRGVGCARLVLGLAGRWLALAAVLVAAAAVFNVLLFGQIAREFASKG